MQVVPITPTPASPGNQRITDEEARALAKATVNLFGKWELTDREACVLLGDISISTWGRWKRGNVRGIPRDRRSRMAILIGIHKGLRYLFRDPECGYAWIRKPNTVFDGVSALDVMMQGEITDLIKVRDYLGAERA